MFKFAIDVEAIFLIVAWFNYFSVFKLAMIMLIKSLLVKKLGSKKITGIQDSWYKSLLVKKLTGNNTCWLKSLLTKKLEI